jgi:3-methyl-2-oxobutanoate hydroxymethyltransferase
MLNDATALDAAGAFAIVLECVPEPLSKLITEQVSVPTIGIGAGKYCDGQVQVISDLLGLYTDFVPKHAKQYTRLFEVIKNATSSYIGEVKAGTFPTEKQSYPLDESVLAELTKPKPKR